MPVFTAANASTDATGTVTYNLENELGMESQVLQKYPLKSVQVIISSAASVQLSLSQDGTNFENAGSAITSSDWVTLEEVAKYMRVAWSGNNGQVTVLIGI